MQETCYLLSRLPVELRLRIYEEVLRFDRPVKLRQLVAGSRNTAILRVNKQIYHEALPVLYDINKIIVTRNDFCQDTDADLQTPLRRDQLRHLLIRTLSQSIRCSSSSDGLQGCCDVCKPSAIGFLNTLVGLPRLQSVLLEYQNHVREFDFIKHLLRDKITLGREPLDLKCTDLAKYSLSSASLPPGLSIKFVDSPLNAAWNSVSNQPHSTVVKAGSNDSNLSSNLGLPNKIFYLHCARHYRVNEISNQPIFDAWDEVEAKQNRHEDSSASWELLTNLVRKYCEGNDWRNDLRAMSGLGMYA